MRVDVADSGGGIPQDVLDKIFAPFFTTKARGTGLGLAVVRKVVDRHNGKVDVHSEVGKGTVFHLYLPLATKPGSGPQVPAPPAAPVAPPGSGTAGMPPQTAIRYVKPPPKDNAT